MIDSDLVKTVENDAKNVEKQVNNIKRNISSDVNNKLMNEEKSSMSKNIMEKSTNNLKPMLKQKRVSRLNYNSNNKNSLKAPLVKILLLLHIIM
jgi:uncharacterized protein YaaW (UPF0174 family)